MNKGIVSLEDVCFSYEKEMVLRHLSLAIEAHRVTFIMGNNGSGKTTLLKNLMGFLTPQSGRISVGNINVKAIDRKSMSRLVSYVPQAIHLNSDFSVVDYLSLGRTPHMGTLAGLSEGDFQIIEKYSLKLGVNSILNVPFNKLSGGQKQIVAITRSLIQDTPLIVMDEPMSALDIGKQVDLLKVFHELVQEEKTIILTTHNPNHALAINSDACFLKHGEIIAHGDSRQIITGDLIHAVYGENVSLDHSEKCITVVFDTDALFK